MLANVKRRDKRRRVALAWWGSVAGGGATVGDLLALRAACLSLAKCALDFGVICEPRHEEEVSQFAEIVRERWSDYAALLWVCGPLIAGSPGLLDLFRSFEGRPRLAVGVSILPESSADHFNGFDVCLARDGIGHVYGDLALAAPRLPSALPIARAGLGLCLRGRQREYGLDRCEHIRTEALADAIVRATDLPPIVLDTKLGRTSASAATIERQFGAPELIVTSRLHGALLALRYDVPFIAIDQIRGGGKVSEVVSRLGWPWVFRADRAEFTQLVAAARAILKGGAGDLIALARTAAENEAQAALGALTASLSAALEW